MNRQADSCGKWTESLLDWMSEARADDQTELIVRLKDPDALERPQNQFDLDNKAILRAERDHADQISQDLVRFIHQLEEKGMVVKLLNTSWLTHSVLVAATPPVVELLTERDDVDLIDTNAEVAAVF